MSCQNFPSEIITKILSYLPYKTTYQCIFVCKSWSVSAIIEYHSTLRLGGKEDFPLDILFKEVKSGKFKYFRHGYLVKNLILTGELYEFLDPVDFCLLCLCLPHLKTIDVTECFHREEVLEALSNHHDDLRLNNLEAIYSFKAKPLKGVNYDLALSHFEACLAFKDTITHLRVHDVETECFEENGGPKSFLEHLHQFTQLTSLEIDDHPFYLSRHVQTLVPYILMSCPKLTNLRIARHIFAGEKIGASESKHRKLPLVPVSHRLSSLDNKVNLKSLELVFSNLDKTLMEYIISNISTSQLNKLSIVKLRKDPFNDFVANEDVFLKFIRHISLAKDLHFQVHSYPFDGQSPRHTWYNASKTHRVFWKMIQAVKNKQSLKQISVEIHFLHERGEIHPLAHSELFYDLSIKNKILHFTQEITFNDFFTTSNIDQLSSDFFTPFIASKPIELEFIIDKSYLLDVFCYIVRKLPKLQALYLANSQCPKDYDLIETRYISYTRFKHPSVSIVDWVDVDSLLVLIQKLVPDLNILQIKDCDIPRSMRGNFKEFKLDLTAFDQLKILNLNLRKLFYPIKDIVLRFKYVREDGYITRRSYYRSIRAGGRHTFRRSERREDSSFRNTYTGIIFTFVVCNEIEAINVAQGNREVRRIS